MSIKNGVKLGRFKDKKIRIRKGKYIFIGQRKGYITVRKELEVDGPMTVALICTDKV